MSWLSHFLNPGKGYQNAQNQLNQYYNQGQGFIQPYNQQGLGQAENLNNYINSLMDPQALQDKWSEGYKESDAAKNAEAMASQHGLDAASSMGLMGSSPALQAIQAGTSQIGAADKQQYLNDLMQKYMQGAGLSQNMYGIGANAGNQLGQNAMNQGQNAAQLAYGQYAAGPDLFARGLGGGMGLLSTAMAGGNQWNTKGGK